MNLIKIFVFILIVCQIYSNVHPKITLSMCVKNEANRYLRMVLEEVKHYIDEAVFIDDNSTDNTIELIKEILAGIPIYIVSNSESKFSNEILLRKQQWQETLKHDPEWILNLDADEIFEKKMRSTIKQLTNQTSTDIWCFRLYDFWDMEHYREDQFWRAHSTYRVFLIRYKKEFSIYMERNIPALWPITQ